MPSLFVFFAQEDGSNENIVLICCGAAVNAVRAQCIPVVQIVSCLLQLLSCLKQF